MESPIIWAAIALAAGYRLLLCSALPFPWQPASQKDWLSTLVAVAVLMQDTWTDSWFPSPSIWTLLVKFVETGDAWAVENQGKKILSPKLLHQRKGRKFWSHVMHNEVTGAFCWTVIRYWWSTWVQIWIVSAPCWKSHLAQEPWEAVVARDLIWLQMPLCKVQKVVLEKRREMKYTKYSFHCNSYHESETVNTHMVIFHTHFRI